MWKTLITLFRGLEKDRINSAIWVAPSRRMVTSPLWSPYRAESTDFPYLFSFSLQPSLSSIAPCRSFKLHPVSAQSWCKSVFDARSTLARPCAGVSWRTSLMSSSLLLLQQFPTCLVYLTRMVFEMEGKWPYWIFSKVQLEDESIHNTEQDCA